MQMQIRSVNRNELVNIKSKGPLDRQIRQMSQVMKFKGYKKQQSKIDGFRIHDNKTSSCCKGMAGPSLFVLLTVTTTARGLLLVLSLHSSSRSTTKWTDEREVNVLLRFNPNHE
jgi:hypothetical protein